MNGIIRLNTVVNRVRAADPARCLHHMQAQTADLPPADLTVFPKLALCAPSCGSLFAGPHLPERCTAALGELQAHTANRDGYILVGLAISDEGRPVSVMAVLHRGAIVGLVRTTDDPQPLAAAGLSAHLLPAETFFACGDMRFCVLGCSLDNLTARVVEIAKTGCDLIVVPACSPVHAGRIERVRRDLDTLAASLGIAIAVVNGGVGDTTAPYLYEGFCCVNESGRELAFARAGGQAFHRTVDLDVECIRAAKTMHTAPPTHHSIRAHAADAQLLRPVARDPFLACRDRAAYLDELFHLQVHSLAGRMANIGVEKLVIGISGGLDSTAALLCCAGAVDALRLPRENIVAVTMPGPGTSGGTLQNAEQLIAAVGAQARNIPISEAVKLHLAAISHSGEPDVVYENAQARERTQILLDIANAVGGIVVGTGDMSEAALGFCTFAGDHIASYNVNSCICKTVLRELSARVAATGAVQGVQALVQAVIDTPVSPELLPPSASGDIAQRTEEIVGPYELHDFFLYHYLHCHMRPAKLFRYACAAFDGHYPPSDILQTLRTFFRRFYRSQFKRACAPEAASISLPNLLGTQFSMPADLDATAILEELDRIDP